MTSQQFPPPFESRKDGGGAACSDLSVLAGCLSPPCQQLYLGKEKPLGEGDTFEKEKDRKEQKKLPLQLPPFSLKRDRSGKQLPQ